MHCCEALAHVDKDGEDLRFGEPFAQTTVHHVDDAAARAVLHEDEDLVGAAAHAVPGGVDEVDDVGMTLEDALSRRELCLEGVSTAGR